MTKRATLGVQEQQQLGLKKKGRSTGPVECLGHTFENEEARCAHFTERLREKLEDSEFRNTSGFPKGEVEDILRMSDPPYYTACPNPFLDEFVALNGKPYDAATPYEREPFAVDVSEGKTDQIYKAHGYHTKVPHLAIVPPILHYTQPGDTVLDGFCGSGMTGLAAQYCGTAPTEYRAQLEGEWKGEGLAAPVWGGRHVVLNDIGPAATFIAAGYNLPFDLPAFEHAARSLLDALDKELGWMYETIHTDGKTRGRINYAVWSEVFSCPECTGDVNFIDEALDIETRRTREVFACPHCRAELSKKKLERLYVNIFDSALNASVRTPKRVPSLVNYTIGSKTYEKAADADDLAVLERIKEIPLPSDVPTQELPYMHMTHERARMDAAGITHLHHFFLPRSGHALAALWRRACAEAEPNIRRMLLWFAEQAIWSMSVLNRFRPTGYSQVSQYLTGVYYVPSQTSELSPWYILHDANKRTTKVGRLAKAFFPSPSAQGFAAIGTGDCAALGISSSSVDYIFTDPPFGENIYYADLNCLVEAWHRVFTNADAEAIVDQAKKKGVQQYQELMRVCFAEYHRVLKPGRWMTVVFSNSSNGIWRAIQEAMGTAGFVIADVRTLDKKQGSYRQVTSSAVKQDLVISAYKPTEVLTERFTLGKVGPDSAWVFVSEHLRNVPVFVGRAGTAESLVERTAQMLKDRMTAFHVQRGLEVPIDGPDFLAGLEQRFTKREGMYFLPEQVAEYDRKRTTVGELRQLNLHVTDEASAIQWLRQQLHKKPQKFQEMHPLYIKQTQSSWAKHEETVELRTMLEQNFLYYDGKGPVPSQIHAYLSTNFKDLRNCDKKDSELRSKAKERWYVADPGKQTDLEKLRDKALLREFESYKASTQRMLRQFRTEALRAGFKGAYDVQDYRCIVDVAMKIPESVLQEDEKLLMYYDVASMRLGKE